MSNDSTNATAAAGPVVERGVRALTLTAPELHDLPSAVLRQLTGKALREFAVQMRGQRNTYHNLWQQQADKSERLQRDLDDARAACRRMAEAARQARTFYRCCAEHEGMSFQMTVESVVSAATVCPLCSAP